MGLQKWQQDELDNFKVKTKGEILISFCNSLSFFCFDQWLNDHYDNKKEKQEIKDQFFNAWSKQIMQKTGPLFQVLNNDLNHPKLRWDSIISGGGLSVEDYGTKLTESIREIKDQFNNLGRTEKN